MDTDGELVEIQMLNDYTGSKVKDEMSEFETKGIMQVIKVCNAVHGGEQDNPKGKQEESEKSHTYKPKLPNLPIHFLGPFYFGHLVEPPNFFLSKL